MVYDEDGNPIQQPSLLSRIFGGLITALEWVAGIALAVTGIALFSDTARDWMNNLKVGKDKEGLGNFIRDKVDDFTGGKDKGFGTNASVYAHNAEDKVMDASDSMLGTHFKEKYGSQPTTLIPNAQELEQKKLVIAEPLAGAAVFTSIAANDVSRKLLGTEKVGKDASRLDKVFKKVATGKGEYIEGATTGKALVEAEKAAHLMQHAGHESEAIALRTQAYKMEESVSKLRDANTALKEARSARTGVFRTQAEKDAELVFKEARKEAAQVAKETIQKSREVQKAIFEKAAEEAAKNAPKRNIFMRAFKAVFKSAPKLSVESQDAIKSLKFVEQTGAMLAKQAAWFSRLRVVAPFIAKTGGVLNLGVDSWHARNLIKEGKVGSGLTQELGSVIESGGMMSSSLPVMLGMGGVKDILASVDALRTGEVNMTRSALTSLVAETNIPFTNGKNLDGITYDYMRGGHDMDTRVFKQDKQLNTLEQNRIDAFESGKVGGDAAQEFKQMIDGARSRGLEINDTLKLAAVEVATRHHMQHLSPGATPVAAADSHAKNQQNKN